MMLLRDEHTAADSIRVKLKLWRYQRAAANPVSGDT